MTYLYDPEHIERHASAPHSANVKAAGKSSSSANSAPPRAPLHPSGLMAWYYWVGAGAVDIAGGGPEDPFADAIDAGILGEGEAAATAAAARAAVQQAANETAANAIQTAARLALLAKLAADKANSEAKAAEGGASCSASGSPQDPNKQDKKRPSANQMNQEVKRGQAPRGVTHVDRGKIPGEQDNVHFSNGSSLNQDGSWKHLPPNGEPSLTNAQRDWLQSWGWTVPK